MVISSSPHHQRFYAHRDQGSKGDQWATCTITVTNNSHIQWEKDTIEMIPEFDFKIALKKSLYAAIPMGSLCHGLERDVVITSIVTVVTFVVAYGKNWIKRKWIHRIKWLTRIEGLTKIK